MSNSWATPFCVLGFQQSGSCHLAMLFIHVNMCRACWVKRGWRVGKDYVIMAKVRSYLDLMDVQDLNLSLSLSSTSSSFSSSSTFDLHPLSIGAERWQVVEKTTQQILSIIQPTLDSEKRRKEIIEYIQALIEDSFGIKVFPFGSVPLKTYLPHGDVDLTALSHCDSSQDLAADICNLLQDEEKNNTSIQVRNVLYVPAQVRVVKCTVGNVAVDISFNQTAGLCALYFLEQVDQFIGKDHLFKRSVILIKAWCYYESRLLGGYHGLISTYALETMVLHVINHFHSSLHCPLAVLYKFLEYYSTFDWERYCIGINGLVFISSLPEIAVQPPPDSDEVLLPDSFLRSAREAFSSYTGVLGMERPAFPVKFLNVLDPLRDDNNLGRSVSKGSFYRIRSALSYGTEKLGDVLILPPEKIGEGLEKFFVNTLERSGRGRRADVLNPVPPYGAESCEISSANRDTDNLLASIQYGLWFHDYGMIYPLQPCRPAAPQVWTNGWVEMGHNVHYDQNMYYNVDKSPPSSVNSPTGLQLPKAATFEEKRKSKGTGPYIPHFDHFLQDGVDMEGNGKEWESVKEVGRVDSQTCMHKEETFVDEGEGTCVFQFTVEEFPVLPGSKPIPIKVSQSASSVSMYEQANESTSSESLEFGSLKHSSPRSLSLSEPGKQFDSDVLVTLDSSNEPSAAVEEDQESSKSEEKLVIPVQPLELTDEKEFPPLIRPPKAKPEIRVNKKEFPPLGAASKSEKRNKWKRNSKENSREKWMGTSTSI